MKYLNEFNNCYLGNTKIIKEFKNFFLKKPNYDFISDITNNTNNNYFNIDNNIPSDKLYQSIINASILINKYQKINLKLNDIKILQNFINTKNSNISFNLIDHGEYTQSTIRIKYNEKTKEPPIQFNITSLEDDWFLVEVDAPNSYIKDRVYKCDTIDGVKQLLLKYKEFYDDTRYLLIRKLDNHPEIPIGFEVGWNVWENGYTGDTMYRFSQSDIEDNPDTWKLKHEIS